MLNFTDYPSLQKGAYQVRVGYFLPGQQAPNSTKTYQINYQ